MSIDRLRKFSEELTELSRKHGVYVVADYDGVALTVNSERSDYSNAEYNLVDEQSSGYANLVLY